MQNKILIVGPSWVGDMMMAQVIFQLLHQQHNELHVLAPAWSEALLSRMPEVTRSIVLPFSHGELQLRARYQFAKQLRAEKYQQAIVLPNSWKSALIPYWARISKRTGWLGEYRIGVLNDIRVLNQKKLPTMIQRFAALAFPKQSALPADLPTPTLSVNHQNISIALQKYQLSIEKPIIALCPGAEFGPSKCWPTKYYAQVANQKISEGYFVWIMGSKNDISIADEICASANCVNLAGKTTLADATDLLSLVKMVVTNDSGLMHIAAAVGCRVIAIYGSTSPELTPPASLHATILKTDLPCQPCFQRTCPLKHHHCMQFLTPDHVLRAMQ